MIHEGKKITIQVGKWFNYEQNDEDLVVDDESDICITFANVLEDNGLVVDTFDAPGLALEHFKKDRYDLLILDILTKDKGGGF